MARYTPFYHLRHLEEIEGIHRVYGMMIVVVPVKGRVRHHDRFVAETPETLVVGEVYAGDQGGSGHRFHGAPTGIYLSACDMNTARKASYLCERTDSSINNPMIPRKAM